MKLTLPSFFALLLSFGVNAQQLNVTLLHDSAFGSVWDTYDTTLVAYNVLQPNGYFGVYFAHITNDNHLTGETCFTCLNNTLPGKNTGAPVFQKGGKYVAFVAEKAIHPGSSSNSVPGIGTFSDVWVMTRDGQKAYQMTNTADTGNASGIIFPFFSPDGTEFSWTEMVGPVSIANGKQYFGSWVIKIANLVDDPVNGPRFANTRIIQPDSVMAFNEAYGWSPDGSKILFASCYNQFWVWDDQIYSMDTNGTNITQLTNCCKYNEHGFYSPDGKNVVWMTNAAANTGTTGNGDDYWIMNSDGSNQRRLTYFNDSTSSYWTGSSHELGHGCYNTTGNRIIADVGGNQPIQTDPSQIGQVYVINLSGLATNVQPDEPDNFSCTTYPNPATGSLQISATGAGALQYGVYNLTGELVQQGERNSAPFSINLNALSNGLYFVKLSRNGRLFNTKFVVAK